MNSTEFEQIVADRLKAITATLVIKAKEYARGDDRLHNFKRGAQMSNQTPERVLQGFLLKHQISLMDILDDIEKGNFPNPSVIDEKIGDIINYMILLEAALKERYHSSELPFD